MAVHPQAIVGSEVQLADDVEVGPFAVIEGQTTIGGGTRIFPHVVVTGYTTIGAGCEIHPGAIVGHVPQDLKFTNEPSYTRIGDNTIIREGTNIHRGTAPGSTTSIGSNCFLMAHSHFGHNCTVEDDVIVANGALLAGHVSVGHAAFVSGNATIHQFVRIGARAMVAGLARVEQDIPPYMTHVECLVGLNLIGLRRSGMSADVIRELGTLYKLLFRKGLPLAKALDQAEAIAKAPESRHLIEFCRADSKRGIERGPRRSKR